MTPALWVSAIGVAVALSACGKQTPAPPPAITISAPAPIPAHAPSDLGQTASVQSTFDESRIVLSGISITGTSRQALLAIDKASPVPKAVGDDVMGGRLVAIESDFVVIAVDGKRVSITFPHVTAAGTGQTKTAPSPEIGPMAKALAAAPEATFGSLPSQGSGGTGNATFLDAIEKASERARAR